MSASPSRVRVAAIPPVRPFRRRAARRPAVAANPTAEEPPVAVPWWTPESIKGWAGSVSLHAVLLLILGFWYFARAERRPDRLRLATGRIAERRPRRSTPSPAD